MKAIVAGGTGFMGRHISAALLHAGHEVTVLGRSPDKVATIPLLKGARAVRGDVTDPSSLRGVLDGADAVVGAVQFPNYPVELPRKGLTFDNYDRRGTENLAAEAVRAGVGRYVYLSGVGADVASDKSWYRAKGLAEAALRRSDLEVAVVRPSWAYGPEDKALNRFVQIARYSPVVPRLGLGPQLVQPVHVDDVAAAFRRIFEVDQAWGETFEIGGPEALTMDEIIHVMLDVVGRKRAVVPVPLALAKLGTAPLVVLPKPPMSPTGVEFASQDGLVDNSKLEKILDVHPVALREGLSRYLNA